jgi:hypothetical protein
MHREGLNLFRAQPPHRLALAAGLRLSAEEPASEGDAELLPNLTIVVRHDVPRIRVEARDAVHLDVVAGLFLNFADNRLGDALAKVMSTARKRPELVVDLVNEQQGALGYSSRSVAATLGRAPAQAPAGVQGRAWRLVVRAPGWSQGSPLGPGLARPVTSAAVSKARPQGPGVLVGCGGFFAAD